MTREPVSQAVADFVGAFPYTRIRWNLRPERPLEVDQYVGGMIRGAVGWALRDLLCEFPDRERCLGCAEEGACPLPLLYGAAVAREHGYASTSHGSAAPLVFRPPPFGQLRIEAGGVLEVTAVLVGWARSHTSTLLSAMARAGRDHGLGAERIRFEVCSAEVDEQPRDSAADSDEPTLERADSPSALLAPHDLQLMLRTPLRLKYRGQLLRSTPLAAEALVRALCRRVGGLADLYAPTLRQPDWHAIVQSVRNAAPIVGETTWSVWHRRSHRQGRTMDLGGLLGRLDWRNVPAPVAALVRLGSHLHLGKGASAGLGAFELMQDDPSEATASAAAAPRSGDSAEPEIEAALRGIQLTELKIPLAPVRPIPCPSSLGAELRYGLGLAMFRRACRYGHRGNCRRCEDATSCPVASWFEPGLTGSSHPRPFALRVEAPDVLGPESPCQLRLVLFGPIPIPHAELLLAALRDLATVGLPSASGAVPCAIAELRATGSERQVLVPGGPSGLPEPARLDALLPAADRQRADLRLTLRTPLSLRRRRSGDRPDLPGDVVLDAAWRRLRAVCRAGGAADPGPPPRPWPRLDVRSRLRRVSQPWFSPQQRQEVPLSGLLGSAELLDVPAPTRRLLRAMEWLQIGRATTAGLGVVDVERTAGAEDKLL